MMFAVDVHENRQQRAQMGKLLRICGVIRRKDWVLSVHISGGFYRYVYVHLMQHDYAAKLEIQVLGLDNRDYGERRSHCSQCWELYGA